MTEETNQSPAAAAETGPLTESAAAVLLQDWQDEPEQKEPQVDSARANANAAEEAAERAEAALAPEEAEPEAETSSEEGEEEPEGTTDASDSDDDYVHGNARTRLRDGTTTTVGELKKLADEAREFKRQHGDFTAKQREIETKAAQIAQQEQLFSKTIEQAVAALQHSLPPEPDVALRDSDPILYAQQQWAREDKLRDIARLTEAQEAANAKAQAEQTEQYKQYLANEQTQLYEKIPELRSEDKRREFMNDMLVHAKHYGFNEEEISNVSDHRTMMMVKDAISWRKLQANKPKVAEKAKSAKPVVKPGERIAPTSSISQKHKVLFERAKKTRSVDDFGALLAELE